jgi:phosphopantothenoylcysteine synthetase/decarboxylase
LEDKAVRTIAEKKLKEKNLDMIIANNPSAIGADENDVDIKVPNKNWLKIKRQSKLSVAERTIRIIEDIRKPTATG